MSSRQLQDGVETTPQVLPLGICFIFYLFSADIGLGRGTFKRCPCPETLLRRWSMPPHVLSRWPKRSWLPGWHLGWTRVLCVLSMCVVVSEMIRYLLFIRLFHACTPLVPNFPRKRLCYSKTNLEILKSRCLILSDIVVRLDERWERRCEVGPRGPGHCVAAAIRPGGPPVQRLPRGYTAPRQCASPRTTSPAGPDPNRSAKGVTPKLHLHKYVRTQTHVRTHMCTHTHKSLSFILVVLL